MKKIILSLVVFLFLFGSASASIKRTVGGRYGRSYVPAITSIKKIIPQKVAARVSGFDDLPISEKKWSYVLAAHPDDEVLCCGTTIQKILNNGGNVKVVIFTNGDAHHDSAQIYGKTRKKESIEALKKIGVAEKNVYFLGFPDDGLAKLSNKIFTSPYSGQSKADKDSTFPNIDYTQENLENSLRKIFKKFVPKELFLPSQDDKHVDHRAIGELGEQIWNEQALEGHLFFYTIHGRTNGQSAAKKDQSQKWEWIQSFRSQFHNFSHKKFLQQFSILRERFTVSD